MRTWKAFGFCKRAEPAAGLALVYAMKICRVVGSPDGRRCPWRAASRLLAFPYTQKVSRCMAGDLLPFD